MCLGAATLASLAIPWTLKRAIDALQHDPTGAPLARYVLLIVVFALANGVARLGSRFAIIGGGQRIEYDLRNDLYASFLAFPPRFYAAHPTGDLMTRASSDVAAVKSLVGFGVVSLAGTAFAFAGALLAMLAVDPWLTLWALAPYPALIVLSKRFNAVVHERSEAAQEQLGVLSAKVQEYVAGMTVVRAYTLEGRAAREFGRENDEYLSRSLALARSRQPFPGRVLIIGTPAEEGGGGKILLAEAGVFDDVDASFMLHPSRSDMVRRSSLASSRVELVFHGKASHAAGAPDQGINALEAVIQTFNGINARRLQMRSAA